jgi:hypothetical protein
MLEDYDSFQKKTIAGKIVKIERTSAESEQHKASREFFGKSQLNLKNIFNQHEVPIPA